MPHPLQQPREPADQLFDEVTIIDAIIELRLHPEKIPVIKRVQAAWDGVR